MCTICPSCHISCLHSCHSSSLLLSSCTSSLLLSSCTMSTLHYHNQLSYHSFFYLPCFDFTPVSWIPCFACPHLFWINLSYHGTYSTSHYLNYASWIMFWINIRISDELCFIPACFIGPCFWITSQTTFGTSTLRVMSSAPTHWKNPFPTGLLRLVTAFIILRIFTVKPRKLTPLSSDCSHPWTQTSTSSYSLINSINHSCCPVLCANPSLFCQARQNHGAPLSGKETPGGATHSLTFPKNCAVFEPVLPEREAAHKLFSVKQEHKRVIEYITDFHAIAAESQRNEEALTDAFLKDLMKTSRTS